MGMGVFRLAQTSGVGRFAARDARGELHSCRCLQRRACGGALSKPLCTSYRSSSTLVRASSIRGWPCAGVTHILWALCPVVLAQHTSYPVLRKTHRSSPELITDHALHAFCVAWKSVARKKFLRRHEQIGGVCAGPLRHGRQWNRARARARRGETKSLKRFGWQR